MSGPTVPWCALTYCDDNPGFVRWDQFWLGRILRGEEGAPPFACTFEEATPERVLAEGGIIVAPVGHYHDHGEKHRVLPKLWSDLKKMPWGILIATSDEGSTFDWRKIDPWPEHIQLYVQLPRRERSYPAGTRFFGEGPPTPARQVPQRDERDLDVFLSSQVNHRRRTQCHAAVKTLRDSRPDLRVELHATDGFLRGMSLEEYLARLARTWVAPAPSGVRSQSSFRAFEALEAGAIPLVDGVRPDGGSGYWEMIGMGDVVPVIDDWSRLPEVVDDLLVDRHFTAARISSRWQQYKRQFVRTLHWQAKGWAYPPTAWTTTDPEDRITVIIPTSPVPSNPDLSMIQETTQSIRIDLPGAEILIACDGVRAEQAHRASAYHEYLHRLCVWTLAQHNVTPFVFDEHLHQSGMMRRMLDEIYTTTLLFVEHDCPLTGPVPWRDLLETFDDEDLASIRLMHEADVLPEHAHLYPTTERQSGAVPWIPTVQWSQRPHLARVAWYRAILNRFFGENSRTMIEDVMHGVVQHGIRFTDGKPTWGEWERWGMAVYAPEGSMKRSGHTDGRGDDPKYQMFFAYDSGRPEGAPPEGWR